MKFSAARIIRHGLAAAVAALFLLPLFWIVAASLRAPGLPPPHTLVGWPQPAQWSNYADLFTRTPFGRYLLNSLFVVALATPLTVITASWAGFALAQLAPRERSRWVMASIGLLMIPATAVWLTRLLVIDRLGLNHNYVAVLLPALFGSHPLFVLLFYWAFRRVPAESWEAARLEGAGAWTLWARLALPLTRPAQTVVAVLAFWQYWSDYVNPLLYLRDPHWYTLALGLQQLQQLERTHWPLLLAACVVYLLPPLMLFLAAQRPLERQIL